MRLLWVIDEVTF